MYAQLGTIRFEGQNGFTSFSHARGVNYAQNALINGKPKLQAVGAVLDSISLEITLHSSFTNPEADVLALKTAMENKTVLPLILGNGTVLGYFVIPNFTQTTGFADPIGNLISANLSVELLECYIAENANSQKTKAINDAFATTLRGSNLRSVAPANLSVGLDMTREVAKIDTSAAMAEFYLKSAKENPQQKDYWGKKINKTLESIEENITLVQSKLSISSDLQGLQNNVPLALSNVNSRVQNMKQELPLTDLANFDTLSKQLKGSTVALKSENSFETICNALSYIFSITK